MGVTATADPTAVLAAPDCVVHMARVWGTAEVATLLGAGINVVTTRGEPEADDTRLPADSAPSSTRHRARGNASLYATGSSPGFSTDALPFALLSLQRDVDLVEIDEFADLSQRDSPHLLFEQMGFGRGAENVRGWRAGAEHFQREFSATLAVLAEAAGRPVDGWEVLGEVAVAAHDATIVAGPLEQDVAAQRTVVTGTAAGAPVVRSRATWYCTKDVDPAWDLRDTGSRPGPRRRSARRADHVSRAAAGTRRDDAVDHRQPAGERSAVRVRRAARHPHERRPAAVGACGHPRAPAERRSQ